MSEIEVRMVTLEPLRVASAIGFGTEPEGQAWEKILAFVKEKEFPVETSRFYGFNNPNPSSGSPNYGYEQWVVVDDDVEGTDDVTIKTFGGGLYAVTRCEGLQNIGDVWKALVHWRDKNPYQRGHHQWLEQQLNVTTATGPEDYIFDLYLPVARASNS